MTRITVGATIDTPAGPGRVVHLQRYLVWHLRRSTPTWNVVVEVAGGRRTFTAKQIVEHLRYAEPTPAH